MSSIQTTPHVGILLATHNGAHLLPDQLRSLANQDHTNWSLIASDDGSTDESMAVLDEFAHRQPQSVITVQGPSKGTTQNFLFLLRNAQKKLPTQSYIAFCDQDDKWLPNKLTRSITALRSLPPNLPALYCSRTWITDESFNNRRLSQYHRRRPHFRNALVQNIAAGNTILLNPPATRLLCTAAHEVETITMHDWWAYQLITGAGGHVIYDETPTLLYRQHQFNQIGANCGLRAKAKRIGMIAKGRFRLWNDRNIAALMAQKHHLTPENKKLLSQFSALRNAPLPRRMNAIYKLQLYRQTTPSTIALWLSTAIGKL